MTEAWTQSELAEYLKNGATPKSHRDKPANADLELPTRRPSVAKKTHSGHPARVCITFVHYRKRLADPDGLSAKAAIDGLVKAGILSDDSAKEIQEVRHRQIKADEEKTVIEITEAIEF